MSHILVVQVIVLVLSVWSSGVSYSSFSSCNVIDLQNVLSAEFKVLLLRGSRSRNIIYVLLISHEFGGLWLQISNALQGVLWI
jgi:hypothetical protein